MSPININARNVNEALPVAIRYFTDFGSIRRIAPRDPNKVTLEIIVPVCTTYKRPLERVLFCPQRDANPFFHFFEALWILNGRRDVEWLANFLARMRDYSDNGKTFHGAYGDRMRRVENTLSYLDGPEEMIDQLGCVVEQLKHDPDSRRAVVAIWQPTLDAGYSGKDMPCNCTLTFKVRDGRLNMTIFNRSNDMVWGAYGANVVQFSTIMEYVAGILNLQVGTMYQWSDSFHVYEAEPAWQRIASMGHVRTDPYTYAPNFYALLDAQEFDELVRPFRLVHCAQIFDTELVHFCNRVKDYFGTIGGLVYMDTHGYDNVYFDSVARPLLNAFLAHRRGDQAAAVHWAHECMATDWRVAAVLWLRRRYDSNKGA